VAFIYTEMPLQTPAFLALLLSLESIDKTCLRQIHAVKPRLGAAKAQWLCPPLSWKVGSSINGHWVNCLNSPGKKQISGFDCRHQNQIK